MQTQLKGNSDDDVESTRALRGNSDYDNHDDIFKVLIAIMMILNTDLIP